VFLREQFPQLGLCRRLLAWAAAVAAVLASVWPAVDGAGGHCPVCGTGRLLRVQELPGVGQVRPVPVGEDTS
jgi:hypothetical protein